jgi:predicted nucleic acid-binding protein
LLIPGEHTEAARAAFQADPEWVAPAYWRVEFLNVLSTYCRTARLAIAQAVAILDRAVQLVRDMPSGPDAARVLEMSVTTGCSGYDCLFVALAEMSALPLVTFDQKLLKAFPATAITPELIDGWFSKRRQAK